MVEEPAEIREALINYASIMCQFVFYDDRCAGPVDAERIDPTSETCWVFGMKERDVEKGREISLKELLYLSFKPGLDREDFAGGTLGD